MTAAGLSCGVLGGKGFIGSAIVEGARRLGHRVAAIDVEEYAGATGSSFDILINANGNSRKYLAARDPANEFDLSVRSVMRALHDFTADLYVHLSTMDVYPDHADPARTTEQEAIDIARLSPYGAHKFLAEQLVRYYSKNWIIFRMNGFVGPRLWKNSVYDLLKGRPLRVHPDSEYQYLHTRTLAEVIFRVAQTPNRREVFNVTGAGLISLRDIAGWIPGCRLDGLPADLPRERYDLHTGKIRRLLDLPDTRSTVKGFVEKVVTGAEPIA